MPDVEFIVDPPDGPDGPGEHDDVVDAGSTPRRPSWYRALPVRSWPVRLAVAAVLTGLIAAWLATRPSAPPSQAVAAPQRSLSVPAAVPPPPGSGGDAVHVGPYTPGHRFVVLCGTLIGCRGGRQLVSLCDPGLLCRTAVPMAVIDALHRYLPGATRIAADSVFYPDSMLRNRTIEAHVDSITVLIRIRAKSFAAPTHSLREIWPAEPGMGSALLHLDTPGFLIDLQWTAPETEPPPMHKLHRLAADPRLQAPA